MLHQAPSARWPFCLSVKCFSNCPMDCCGICCVCIPHTMTDVCLCDFDWCILYSRLHHHGKEAFDLRITDSQFPQSWIWKFFLDEGVKIGHMYGRIFLALVKISTVKKWHSSYCTTFANVVKTQISLWRKTFEPTILTILTRKNTGAFGLGWQLIKHNWKCCK